MVMQAVAAALGIPEATAVLYGRRREAVLVAASDATARMAHDLETALGEGATAAMAEPGWCTRQPGWCTRPAGNCPP